MKKSAIIAISILPLLLTGCLESYYRLGAPVKESSPASKAPHAPVRITRTAPKVVQKQPPVKAEEEEVQIVAYAPPARIRARPVHSTAVIDLIQTAEQQRHRGDMPGAAATLERALRIEPRNAYLWNRLANVRLSQERYTQVENLAAKSNALAAADRDLRRENWQLIARARRTAGNADGARVAENKANTLR